MIKYYHELLYTRQVFNLDFYKKKMKLPTQFDYSRFSHNFEL